MKQELANGWVNTDKVYELLKKEYMGNRDKYKTIEDFMPRILEYLKELEKQSATSTVDQAEHEMKSNKDISNNTNDSSKYTEFTNGVTVTRDKNNYTHFKIDQAQLPESMKNFKKVAAPGTDSVTKQGISAGIHTRETTGRGVFAYDSERGFGNMVAAPYYIVMLFDNNGKSLGYHIVDASKIK
jgi:hypothetical protein